MPPRLPGRKSHSAFLALCFASLDPLAGPAGFWSLAQHFVFRRKDRSVPPLMLASNPNKPITTLTSHTFTCVYHHPPFIFVRDVALVKKILNSVEFFTVSVITFPGFVGTLRETQKTRKAE